MRCEVLFIHGEKDNLIDRNHSECKLLNLNDTELAKNCVSRNFSKFPKNMTHNHFDVIFDFIYPVH